jgi:hypothetical protein
MESSGSTSRLLTPRLPPRGRSRARSAHPSPVAGDVRFGRVGWPVIGMRAADLARPARGAVGVENAQVCCGSGTTGAISDEWPYRWLRTAGARTVLGSLCRGRRLPLWFGTIIVSRVFGGGATALALRSFRERQGRIERPAGGQLSASQRTDRGRRYGLWRRCWRWNSLTKTLQRAGMPMTAPLRCSGRISPSVQGCILRPPHHERWRSPCSRR